MPSYAIQNNEEQCSTAQRMRWNDFIRFGTYFNNLK